MNKFKRKYLYISSVDISLSNGPGVNEREFIYTLCKILKDNVRFIIPRPENGLPDELPAHLFLFSDSHQQRNPFLWLKHQYLIVQKFKKAYQDFNPDLLIFRTPVFAFVYLYLTKKFKIPYVLKAEGVGKLDVFKRKSFLWRSLSGINLKIHKKLLSNALMVDTVNKLNVSKLGVIPDDGANIVWIDNAVNTDRFTIEPVQKARKKIDVTHLDPLVGYVGNYPWERGGMQIIETLPYLTEKYPQIGVVILGGGEGLSKLVDKAKKLDVEDRCILTGQVPFKKVPDYVNAIDVGVSISAKTNREMASELKVRQYLSCGKPIVVSPGGSAYLAEEGYGSVVDPTSITQIADELDRWISMTKKEKECFAEKAHAYAKENLSFEGAVNKRLNMWNELLEQRKKMMSEQGELYTGK